MKAFKTLAIATGICSALACGSTVNSANQGNGGAAATTGGNGGSAQQASGNGAQGTATSSTTTSSTGSTSGGMSNESGCHSDISELLAPPKPELACPTLQAGKNQVQSQGGRDFLLVLPNDYDANEVLPVVFLWHWLGGSADSFRNRADVQTAVDHYRLIAVIPEAKGDTLFKWPIEASQSQARIDEELQFFDHMLSCVSGQYKVNAQCISSVGVSAGALFTQVLASGRGQYLSSFVSLSGGSGGLIQPWKGSQNKMPAMVLWGGPKDNCLGLMDFNQCSKTLEQGLGDDGHFFVECVHNCGHAAPPFEPPGAATAFAPMWEFILDHPAWLPSGSSPYSMDGMPQVMPEWCGIGAGSATPRSGECSDKSEC